MASDIPLSGRSIQQRVSPTIYMRQIKTVFLGVCLLFVGAYTVHASPVTPEQGSKEVLQAKVLATFQSQVGVKENLGVNDSKEIREYLRIGANLKAPAYYCAAFVCWGYTINGIKNPKTAWSPGLFPADHCIDIRSNPPLPADAFGIYHNDLKRIAHAGVIKYWPPRENYFISIEANTNNDGSRNGDGVYEKRRPKRTVHKVSRWVGVSQLSLADRFDLQTHFASERLAA
jgi:hypothetical protein